MDIALFLRLIMRVTWLHHRKSPSTQVIPHREPGFHANGEVAAPLKGALLNEQRYNVVMVYYVFKLGLSAILILAISEVAKRSSLFGGVVASIPLVSLLAMIWLYQETKNTQTISKLSHSIFWMVIPSLVLFISLPELLKRMPFYPALGLSCLLTVGAYLVMTLGLAKIGIKL